jgi:ADP-ribose pyrophosphatase
MLQRKAAVGILLYDPALDRVVLIQQFRPGAMNSETHPWLIEVVAGIIDKPESKEAVAIREANEEAGCEVLDLYPICEYFVSPGGSDEYLWLFCGRIDANHAGGIFGLDHEHENIRAFTLSTTEAFDLLETGKIKTAPAILTLQWLKLNREKLTQLWQKK